jgi:alkylhydroperoxidase family enzyme
MKAILDDVETAPIGPPLRAMLRLLETFTLRPAELTPAAVRVALEAGVTREQVRDAFYVAFLFNIYDRLADTLGWELPDARYYEGAGQRLLHHGYL